ncbi:MAG: hypothetical protein JWM32_1929 [Verrucomicrobia bacterium]|nr:hypothetical protein [Verrucomicrobiota bacterium]
MTRRIFVFVFFLVTLGALRAEETPNNAEGVPPLLYDALAKIAENFDRWAYTETRQVTDDKGKVEEDTVVRFDPSQPYAEQYTPIRIKGKPPTERQLKEYRKRGVKRADRVAKDEAAGREPGSHIPQFGVNGGTTSIDLAHAVVVDETAGSITYEVPLRNDGRATIPVEKFRLLARVNRERRAFENIALKVRSGFRVKLVLKVKSGEANIDFGVIDPKHAPALTSISGDATASVMFMTFGGSFDLKRAEFKRVKPYSERFGVKIGPLKALDF